MKSKPELTFDTIKRMEDMTWFTGAQIFDDLLIVAQKETACYIWKTSNGLVIFDGIWPDKRVYKEILSAIKNAGWEKEQITKFVITHGHIDHIGCGKWLKDNQGVKTFLSKEDDELRLSTTNEKEFSKYLKEFEIDCYIADKDVIDCGDKSISVVSTPGHTAGCMSFIFPVYDNGEKHIASLFGGATPPWDNDSKKELQKQSVLKFMKVASDRHCDVALTNHTAFDNGLQRISYSKSRMSYLPNIYVLGEKGVQDFCKVYLAVAE